MSRHPEHLDGDLEAFDEASGPHYRLVLAEPSKLPARHKSGHGHAISRRPPTALSREPAPGALSWPAPGPRVARPEHSPVPRHALAATFEALAAAGSRRLLAASPMRHAGTSSFVAAAGRAIASSGLGSVVLVDAHTQHPGLHRHFGVPCERGLVEALDELYGFDITREDGSQFGVGDWLEVLRAQGRTGQLTVTGEGGTYSIAMVHGHPCALTSSDAPAALRIGERLVQRGRLSREQRDAALRIHEATGRPLGEVLCALSFVDPEDVAEAVQQQCVRGLVEVISMPAPECRFDERAESHACAVGSGRFAPPAARGLDRILRGHVLEYLKQPFLRSQTPSFLHDTELPCLKVLVAGAASHRSFTEPARQTGFGLLLERLSLAFDFVLVDAPAVDEPGSAGVSMSLSAYTDGVMLVVPARTAATDSTRHAIDELRRVGARVLGMVLNRAGERGRP